MIFNSKINLFYVKIKRFVFYLSLKIFIYFTKTNFCFNNIFLLRLLIHLICFGYGNKPWTASPQYIYLIKYFRKCKSSVIELGSGLTTVILSVLSERYEKKFLSIENDYRFYLNTKKILSKFNLGSNIVYRELKNYGRYEWYDISKITLNKIDLVICHGPPKNTKGGRIGIINLLGFLRNNAIIVFDDANRKSEKKDYRFCNKQLCRI